MMGNLSSVSLAEDAAVMVLNAHNLEKIATARSWLDAIPSFPSLRNVGLVLLARETCNNDWLLAYLTSPLHRIRFVCMVYPTKVVDYLHVIIVFLFFCKR